MKKLNIFETIESTTSRIEPIHSRFLADALCESLNDDRSLFDGFWKLAAPPDWPVPKRANVTTEQHAGNRRRIDLCIDDVEERRILGVEVKTTSASANAGQLEAYEDGLAREHPDRDIAIAYLTPFNRERAGDAADRLPTVKLFQAFANESSRTGQHVSWLDIAELSWDGRSIWRDHQPPHSAVHLELFELAERFPNVWIKGERNYGVRVAHKKHKTSGVSLVRSVGPGMLKIGEPR